MIVEETGKEHGSHTAFVNQFANWPGSDKSAKFSWPRSPPSDMPNIFLFSPVCLSAVTYIVNVAYNTCQVSSVVNAVDID